MHNWHGVRFHVDRLLEVDPTSSHYFQRRAVAHRELGNLKQAALDQAKAFQLQVTKPYRYDSDE